MIKFWLKGDGEDGSKNLGMHSIPMFMPSRIPSVKVINKPGMAYSSHIAAFFYNTQATSIYTDNS